MMTDRIVRAMTLNNEVLVLACTSKEAVQNAVSCHRASDVASAALGRTLTIGAMMASQLKNKNDKLTLSVKGDGPLGEIVVTAGNNGKIKGYVSHPNVILPTKNGKLDVAAAVGKGRLRVIKDTGLKEPYIGDVELQTGEIAEDMAYYFGMSEQIPSAVGLGVLVTGENEIEVAGGFLIQLLPFASEESIDKVEQAISKIKSVTDILKNENEPEAVIKALFGDSYTVMEESGLEFACDCNREKLDRVMISLGKKELNDIIAEGEAVEVQCSFCKKNYRFEIEDVKQLLENAQ